MPSRRSGGPRTLHGRKASSQNALKTGAYASTIVLPGEDRTQYQQLEGELMRDFAPADTVSRLLVRTLAGLMWKKLRLERIEHGVLADTLSAPVSDRDNPGIWLGLPHRVAREAVDLALRVPSTEWRPLYQTYQLAAQLSEMNEVTPQALAALENVHPLLWRMLENESAQRGMLSGPEAWTQLAADDAVYTVACRAFVEKYSALPVLIVNEAAILEYVLALKDKRLLAVMKIADVQRAHDDLDRAFCRSLRELRKHQHWLSEAAIVDVGDDDDTPGTPRAQLGDSEGARSGSDG